MTKKHKLEKVASALAYQRTVGVDNRIAELEQKLEQTEKDLADYQFNYPSIKELAKENAQAKEIITELYYSIPSSMADYCKDAMEKAEQFLNDTKE